MVRRFANKESLSGFFFALSCVGGFEAVYMLIQKMGLDPAPWSFVYANTMIGTLGNPDFASAFVALSTPATGFMIYSSIRDKKKAAMFVGVFLSKITALLFSNVYQGPMALAMAGLISCALLVWFNKKGLQYRLVVVSSVVLSGLVATLGVLGQGPLTSIFAKRSFQIRIHAYWDTATEMGLHHLFLGVGPDQFVDYFNRFYSNEDRRIFSSILTDNAHNFFLQFFAFGQRKKRGQAYVNVSTVRAVRFVLVVLQFQQKQLQTATRRTRRKITDKLQGFGRALK
jgi:hypothetical protein